MDKWGKAIGLSVALLLAGCAASPPASSLGMSDQAVLRQLQQQYSAWAGTPYKAGGNNDRGVDCSGFVFQVYWQAFARTLPRTTEQLADVGSRIKKKHLRPGDLVLFKTGYRQRHAGIYLDRGYFIHASTSRGVMQSNLNNPYWKSVYWQSRRL